MMKDEIEKGHAGQSFDGYLKDQETHTETAKVAAKRVLAFKQAAKAGGITKKE